MPLRDCAKGSGHEVAEAEHLLRNGDYEAAEDSYLAASNTRIFPNNSEIRSGMEAIKEWKAFASRATSSYDQQNESGERQFKEAFVNEIEVSGEAESNSDSQ
ncbi:MAG: hypothetical protein AAF226_18085 [Verrucomicrobiota bacterium]